jgi:hypothetical protein
VTDTDCVGELISGMHVPSPRRWRREFGSILCLRAEEYYAAPRKPLTKVLQFLQLSVPTTDAAWAPLLSPAVQLAGTRPSGGLPAIPPAMQKALREFYAPSLAALVASLSDEPDHAEWERWSTMETVRAAA